jgi:hypothetical protein
MNSIKPFLIMTMFCALSQLSAQTYQLTHFSITPTSNPKPFDGLIKITETDLYFSIFDAEKKDTTITKQRIAKNKGKGYYIKTIIGNLAYNYTIQKSPNKNEPNIYYIEYLIAYPDGSRKAMYFTGRLVD